MKLVINNHLVGGVICDECKRDNHWDIAKTVIDWTHDPPLEHAELVCDCGHHWTTDQWKATVIESEDTDETI